MYVPVWIAAVFIVVCLIAPLYAVMSSIGYLNFMKSGGHTVWECRIMTCHIGSQKDGYIFEEIEDSSSRWWGKMWHPVCRCQNCFSDFVSISTSRVDWIFTISLGPPSPRREYGGL